MKLEILVEKRAKDLVKNYKGKDLKTSEAFLKEVDDFVISVLKKCSEHVLAQKRKIIKDSTQKGPMRESIVDVVNEMEEASIKGLS